MDAQGKTSARAHAQELSRGERFEFGENGSRFLKLLGEERIQQAERSLQAMLGVPDLKKAYLEGLSRFDVVYSWGVLHHTGDMSTALENARPLVAESGRLFVAIYNDQGFATQRRTLVKPPWRNLVDRVGGYPFEVANPEQIFDFARGQGLEMCRLATCGGWFDCNQFVFRRKPGVAPC